MENVTTTLENIDVLLDADEYSPPMWAVECGNLAPFATIFIRLAPIPTVYRFIKNKSVGTLPLLPYTALISDSSLWLCFGILVHDYRIILTHANGLIMSSIYGFAYAYIYAREVEGIPRDQIDNTRLPGTIFQHVLLVTLSCACSIAVGILLPLEKATNIVGLAADMGSLFMYAGPLSAVRAVMRDKNAESLPLPLTSILFINALLWFNYGMWGMTKGGWVLWLPSAVGLTFSSIQLFLIFYYGSGNNDKNGVTLKKSSSKLSDGLDDDLKMDDLHDLEELDDEDEMYHEMEDNVEIQSLIRHAETTES